MLSRAEQIPSEFIVDFDIMDPDLADASERLAELREKTPVAYCTKHGGYWILTRYDDVLEAARNYEVFSSTENQVPRASPEKTIPTEMDPPESEGFRKVLNPLFSPQRMNALAEAIRQTTTELIDGFAERGSCDFVQEFAHPLTMATFVTLMGWPLSEGKQFVDWTEAILVGKPGASAEEDFAFRQEANTQVFAYFTRVVQERRGQSGDDPTTMLVNAKLPDGRDLTDDELMKMLWLLMLGGLHTVRGVLGFGLRSFASNPNERQRLIDDPSLVDSAVEEILRLDAPIAAGRVVKKSIELHGARLEPGDKVLAFLTAAGRDPEVFADPDRLEIDRPVNNHLAFGAGPHRCVGSHLARIELKIALEEIHRRIPDYSPDPSLPEVLHHSQVRGVYSLPIRFTPESKQPHQ